MDWLARFRGHVPPPVALDRATETDIAYAYRLILKRDPDAEGLAHYRRIVRDGFSLDQLIRSFENSEEHRFRIDDDTRPTPVDLGGYRVLVQKLDTDFGQAILGTGQYEEHLRQVVRDHVRDGDVCLDIGANIGVITLLAATLVGPRGRVIAVEPNPDNLQLLYRGVVLNGLTNVDVLPFAASDRRAIVTLTGGTSNTHVIAARAAVDRGHFVQTVLLDELLRDLPRLDLVKMDIEGHEPAAFEGSYQLIARHRPTLLVEFNPACLVDFAGQDPAAFVRRLFSIYERVRVFSAFGDDRIFERPEDVIAYWTQRNREIAAEGRLADGLLHFDLLAPREAAS